MNKPVATHFTEITKAISNSAHYVVVMLLLVGDQLDVCKVLADQVVLVVVCMEQSGFQLLIFGVDFELDQHIL